MLALCPPVLSHAQPQKVPKKRLSELPKWAIAIQSRRKARGLTQEDLAYEIDASQAWVSQVERGDQNPTDSSAARLGRLIAVLGWTPAQFAAATGLSISQSLEGLSEESDPRPVGQLVGIRHLGTVTAGTEASFDTNDYEFTEFPISLLNGYEPDDLFALTVVGDSMMCNDVERDIPEGATALFHAYLPPEPGDTIVAWVDHPDLGEIRVLKIHRPGEGYVTLGSLNHKHRPIVVSHDSDFRIMGVFLASFNPGRRLRHSLETRGLRAHVKQQLAKVRKKD